jgi:hypothetical protein
MRAYSDALLEVVYLQPSARSKSGYGLERIDIDLH